MIIIIRDTPLFCIDSDSIREYTKTPLAVGYDKRTTDPTTKIIQFDDIIPIREEIYISKILNNIIPIKMIK